MIRSSRPFHVTLFLCVAIVLCSCGREAPTYTPATLSVTSDPAGATILVNGRDSGRVTPSVLDDLEQGEYRISVSLPGYYAQPAEWVFQLLWGDHKELPFDLVRDVGALAVDSTPRGATILLDGQPTAETTPGLLVDLPVGDYLLAVELTDHVAAPAETLVTVAKDETTAVHFTPAQVVLLEEFSSVYCVNCPDASETLHTLLSSGDYAAGRIELVNFTVPWGPPDPHWDAAPADNEARLQYYMSDFSGAPALILDGDAVLEGTLDAPGNITQANVRAYLDGALDGDPGFAISVEPDDPGATLDVTLTLDAVRSIAVAGAAVKAALIETPIVYASAPGSNGQTVFHGVMRAFVEVAAAPLALEPGVPLELHATFTLDPGWPTASLRVVAFVQDDSVKRVLQAGAAPVVPTPPSEARP